jgi:16S rRNA (guanine527-N7)-methyltransferase
VLVESQARRAGFLAEAVDRLGWAERVTVEHARAEEVGRDRTHRGAQQLVTARGFGPPAVTAECGAPLLSQGGWLVVSEPPEERTDRWPAAGVPALGLGPPRMMAVPARFAVLQAVAPCDGRYPRRTGVPAKRPLFGST